MTPEQPYGEPEPNYTVKEARELRKGDTIVRPRCTVREVNVTKDRVRVILHNGCVGFYKPAAPVGVKKEAAR